MYVDLDGTLIRTDLFAESILQYLRKNPLNVFSLLTLLAKGRSVAKAVLARRIRFDAARLPYEPGLISYIQMRKSAGSKIVLATAAHWLHAQRIARHLGLFDAVLASNGRLNLKGKLKLKQIKTMSAGRPFDYAGDSASDRPIWRAAERVILVNAPERDIKLAEIQHRVALTLRTRSNLAYAFRKGMRLHQWAKNALLFVPLLTSHRYVNMADDMRSTVAFIAFGLCASGNYLINDLLDLEADRAHTTKRKRPLAAGDMPISFGIVGALIFPLLAFTGSILLLPWQFAACMAVYFATSNFYSLYLKRVSTADVITLAVLYTIRVIAGAAAILVTVSSWLLAFSMFTFVSLAYLKRYTEVAALADRDFKAPGRGYSHVDAETMFSLGIANATASTLVLALYISSNEVKTLYRSPDILWFLCLLMLYWSNRVWVGARRGKIHDDPVVFALKDPVSRLIGIAALAVVFLAHLVPWKGFYQ